MVNVLERPPLQHGAQERLSSRRRAGNFGLHFLEMCDDPVRDLPELATFIAAFAMSVGMAIEMRLRRHSWRCIGEMTAAMFVEAVVLIVVAAAGVFDRANLFTVFHALMPVAMVAAMLPRLDVYTAPLSHKA